MKAIYIFFHFNSEKARALSGITQFEKKQQMNSICFLSPTLFLGPYILAINLF